jgi:NAD-dependent dihydropyrimidine dehydrogenase PreA subunit
MHFRVRKCSVLKGESQPERVGVLRSGGNEMGDAEKRDRGLLRVDTDECKGCGLCVEACPPRVIHLSMKLNHYGYRSATYAGSGCTGCGICFMACPEPGAITVMRWTNPKAGVVSGRPGELGMGIVGAS